MSSNSRNSTKTVILAPNPSTSDVGGGTFLINLPSNGVQQQSTNGSMMVPACVRTSSSMNTTTSAAAVGGRVGNTFVLFPVKQLQRNVVVAESSCSSSSSNIQTIIPEVQQKPQILSLAVQQTSAGIINNHNQQQFTPVFFVSSSKPLTNVVDQSGCGVVYSTKDNIDEQNSSSSRFDMGRNRESLKRKLMQRRPIRELVARGILPAPNAPPSFYEQRLKLERAKMGDILKHKIEHRPNKQQLVSQHILLDSSADPSIVDKLQQLKKCKLADSLNEKLAHRPGPLELVQENILHVDAALEQAVKDGRLQFKPTSAGLIQKHPHPVFGNVQDSTTLAPVQQQQDIVVEQVSSAIMLSTVSSSTASSSMLNGVGHNFLQQDNLSTVDRCSTMQMNSSTSSMKSGLTESNDRNSMNSTSMSGIFVGSSNPQQFYVSTNNNQHSSSSSSTCSSPLLTPGGGGCFDKSSTMNGFTLISTNSVVDCSSASSTSVADRVPIIVENLLSSSSSTKSKPKKSKSKTSSSTSSASSSSCQVAVVPTTATISASANNCTTLLTTTNGCSNSNSNACIGSITLSNGVSVSTANNCSNIVTCVNSLPKTKVIKFHEYKGPTSMIGGQKTGLNHNITNGSGKFFLVPSNGLISGVGKQTTTSAVFDNSDGKMVQGIMISCPQNGITVTNGNQLMNGGNDFMDGTSSTTTVTQFDDMNNGKLSETSYDLLLQQQQLMLQWQLELQQKYPNTTVQLVPSVSASSTSTSDMIFADVVDSNNQHNFLMQSNLQQHLNVLHRSDSPTQSGFGTMSVQSSPGLNVGSTAASSMSMPQTPVPLIRSESDTNGNCATKTTSNNQNSSSTNAKPVEKLEDMKVNDLKIECKKRNLPVSGSKPHLLERLKPYEETILSSLKERTANLNKLSSAFDDDSTKPATAPTTNASQNGGALPPISFLSSSANLNLFNSATSSSTVTTDDVGGSIYLQTSPASSCQSEIAGGNCNGVSGGYITNGHSLSVDHSAIASNYSSPGIDLSVLSFGNGNNLNQNGNVLSTNNNNNNATTTNNNNNNNVLECFTFSSPTNFDSISNNRNNICDQSNSIHDQTVVINGVGYNAVLPVHSVVGVTENPSDDANDQRVPILSLHEDMIRGQQSKINELQKELQRSQDILKQQQQLILAAKKVQAEAVEQGNNGGVSDNILSQLDTKQMQKMHIQLFLQQKLQQQQLQQQLNVQRELVATQQRLEEEMHVHQAVTEVVRLLRQEPRVALLVLHLLKKHQSDQQNQTSASSEEQQIEKSPQKNDIRSPNSIVDVAIGTSAGSSTPSNANVGNSAVLSSSSAQSSPKHAPSKKHSSSSVNGESTTKPKNGGGSIKKSSLQHSSNSSNNSNSSAPKTPKSVGGGGGAPIDMEEIFRTVLDYATKATAATSTTVNSNVGADDEMGEMICSDRKTSFVVESNQISSNLDEILPTAALPGCDQIMPQRPAVTTENENGNINGVVGVGNLRQLFNFDQNQLTSATDASYIYTKNEAFDDLMEVLRNNGAPHGVNNVFGNGNIAADLQQSSPPSIPQTTTTSPPSTTSTVSSRGHDQQQQTATNPTASATFLNAFSAQDMADLLSSDWFNVDSVLNAGGCVGVNNVCFDVAHTPQCISTPNSFSSLDKSPMKNDSQLRVTPMDSMFSNPVDNSEQMDWLDLILPSPGVDLPANPPCPVSAGGRSSSLSQTPMETDCMSSSSLDSLITCRRDPLLLSARNSVGNPMLAMSGDCL